MEFTSDRVFCLEIVDRLLLVASNAPKYRDDSWVEQLQITERLINEQGQVRVVFVWGPFASPSARQRGVAAEYATRFGLNNISGQVIISDSAVIRGAMTALKWVAKMPYQLRPFSMTEWRRGMRWLHSLHPFDELRASQVLEEMVTQVDGDARALIALKKAA